MRSALASTSARQLYSQGTGSYYYNLSGNGLLSAPTEYLGMQTSANFNQSGGVNTAATLIIGPQAVYHLTGGTLQFNSALGNSGTFAAGGSGATLNATNILDITAGTWQNLGSLNLNMSANSLLIVPAGFDTSTGFAHYSTLGITHTAGTTLTVPTGMGFSGSGTITDPVNCQGTIAASPSGSISLLGGLTLSGTGLINLGSQGALTTDGFSSCISAGAVYASNQIIGLSGTGSLGEWGGTNGINSANSALYLGSGPGSSGSYTLTGNGLLSLSSSNNVEYIGYSGIGSFAQSGGTNTIKLGTIYLGYVAGSAGTYSLGGSALLTAASEYIGGGADIFTQSSGTNIVASLSVGTGVIVASLSVGTGVNATGGPSGVYNLSGNGLLSVGDETLGDYGNGTFNQSGGTHSISGTLYLGENFNGQYTISATYNLAAGVLTAANETIGHSTGPPRPLYNPAALTPSLGASRLPKMRTVTVPMYSTAVLYRQTTNTSVI